MSKKAKNNLVKIVVALCLVLCVVLTAFELGVTYRTVKAAEVDGTEYSVAEYNWLYTNSVYEIYNDYYSSYGQLAVYFFNPGGNLSEQVYNQETGETWADFVKEYTDNTLVEMTKLYDAGKAAGYEMSEDRYAMIESEWADIEAAAAESGYSANDYVALNYGRGVNEKVFKEMEERYYYAFSYAENFVDSEEVSASEVDAYYGENAELFDNVSYKTYFVSSSAEEGADAEAAKAEAVLAGTEEVELTEYNHYTKASVNPLFADWVFAAERTEGDRELFEASNGYYVVEFVSVNDLHYNTVNVRHVLVAPADSASDAAWQEALVLAEKYETEWKELGGSEENFAEIAAKYSVDSSASNGGLYENIFKGQMVTEFEDWCFDSARKTGDSEIIKTQFGYHIMYFSGVAEDYYTFAVSSAVKSVRLNDYINGLVEGVEVVELSGSKFVGKHFG